MANPVPLQKYAFVAGELDPKLFGRSDLEKYDLGLAEATNFFVDFTGGLSNRSGTKFLDWVQNDNLETRFFPFKFAPNVLSTYVVLFGGTYIRFLQDGAYVLETAVNISAATRANPGVVTANAHGFSNGNMVKIFGVVGMTQLNGRTFVVAGVTANTFQLTDVWGANVNTSAYTVYSSGGTVQRVYTLTSPYANADLALLRGHQARSTITFAHPSYPPYILTRVAHTSWTIAAEVRGPAIAAPAITSIAASIVGTSGVSFIVTAVDVDGNESIQSYPGRNRVTSNYADPAVGGSVMVQWGGVAGAVKYNVYRSRIFAAEVDLNFGTEYGYIGSTYGPVFVDNNRIPDFTVTPPSHRDPLAHGAVDYITVTAGGAGYTDLTVVTVTGAPGTGFQGVPIIIAGAIVGVKVLNGGKNYVGATVSFNVGAGATGTVTLTEASNNNPRVSNVFQQRKVYAGSNNDPLSVFGSVPGDYQNHSTSDIIQEDDAYEFELDAEEVAPIIHLLSTRSGLVIFTQATIQQLIGGNGVAVTPTNALADPQSSVGASLLPPIEIDTDVLFQEGKGSTIRLLTYSDFTKVFASQDLTILSAHLVKLGNPIVAWAFASDPHKLVYAVREDGTMLLLTLVKEQAVFGWATAETQGMFRDVIVLQENSADAVYVMVERFLPSGRFVKFIEQFSRREFNVVEDAWFLDSAIALAHNEPADTLNVQGTGTVLNFYTNTPNFFSAGQGKVVRGIRTLSDKILYTFGKAHLGAYNATTGRITSTVAQEFRAMPQTSVVLPMSPGAWSYDTPTTAITGLWHLEGKTVGILADGHVLPDQVVVNGGVTLQEPATRVIVGLRYQAIAQTLPPTSSQAVIENRRKKTTGVKARVHDTRGLKVGQTLDRLMPFKEAVNELLGEPTELQQGIKPLTIPGNYNFEGQIYFVQDDPLPVTLLGFIQEVDLGDDGK